jgi:hypothetical protein
MTRLPTGLAVLGALPRRAPGPPAAFASIESFEGGTEEFREVIPSRRRNSAFSASRLFTRAINSTSSVASS